MPQRPRVPIPPRPAAPPPDGAVAARGDPADTAPAISGVDESTWMDVIQKMDEVYSQLVADEVALEAKNAELEQSQQFIFSLLSSMSDVLVACNEYGVIEETNAALCELVGCEDIRLRGRPLAEWMAGDEAREALRQVLGGVPAAAASSPSSPSSPASPSSRGASVVELALRDAAGNGVTVEFHVTPRRTAQGRVVGRLFVGRPLGELKRAYHQLREAHEALKRTQQQLLHSEKMASLGRLVAGVAHELNNPISFVLGNVHALQRYGERLERYLGALHTGEPPATLAALRRSLRVDHLLADLPSLIEGTLEGAQRTADIVHGLKRFSAMDRGAREPVDLNGVVERAIHWVKKGTAPNFEVQWEPGPPCEVRGSAGQLLQVVMNLVQNAYDATATAGARGAERPRLSITLEADDDTVRLVFQDNGPGIPPASLSRLFEPFFTTKPVGAGTGLGLSISYGIVEQHGGRLEADNAPAGGARFTLTLPRR